MIQLITGKMPRSGKLPISNLLTGQKSAFSPLKGRPVAQIHVKFGTTKGHMGPLCHTKFHANRFTGVGTRPQNGKNFHFLVKSRPTGPNPLTDIYNIVRDFYTPNYAALVFYI